MVKKHPFKKKSVFKKGKFNKPVKKFKHKFKKRFSKRKEEFRKEAWFLSDRNWLTFIRFYETFIAYRKRFDLCSFNNIISSIIQVCDLFYEQLEIIPNPNNYVHITANDKQHIERLGSSSRSHDVVKMSLQLGVIQQVDSTIDKKSPNCMYRCRKTLYKRLKGLYSIMSKWDDKLYKEFIEHYKAVHKKWLDEKQSRIKKKLRPLSSAIDRTKHFFSNMEISGEGGDIKGYIKSEYKPVPDFKIDWEKDYKQTSQELPDTNYLCSLLTSCLETPHTDKECAEKELFEELE